MISDEFLLQPNIYNTKGRKTLLSLLEEHWIEQVTPGKGTIYIISGFGNYNGGVRFYDIFAKHVERGGKICAMFGGSTGQKLTSKQLVSKLLECGANVSILNRKKIMHAKCFGYKSNDAQSLIVSSGNFTGPGMTQNVEAALGLSQESIQRIGFDWDQFYQTYHAFEWELHYPHVPIDDTQPEWKLLYDEEVRAAGPIEEIEENTLLMTLGHADTARINAAPGTAASKGTQYFWLSKDAFEFFPALTIPNERGDKPTYSTIVKVNYLDLGNKVEDTRVTYEAGNNVDFRLGTSPLRGTRLAEEEDIMALSRRANAIYDLKIIKRNSKQHRDLSKYLINFIGNRGKKYGYIPNEVFDNILR